jgi:hypothetical protein
MKLDFEEGEEGFFEARALHRAVHDARAAVTEDLGRSAFDFLDEAASEHLRRSEFAELRGKHGMGDEIWPSFSVLKHLWRSTWGAAHSDEQLSEQRSAALARAERAEHAAFEATAEAARFEHERDRALSEVATLKQEIARLQEELAGRTP